MRPGKLQHDDVHSEIVDAEAKSASPTSDSHSYTVPGSSGTMKETHIFTPITKPTNMIGTPTVAAVVATSAPIVASVTTNAIEPFLPTHVSNGIISQTTCENDPFQSDTIIIKENVVKKEYRDVEYEPSKLVANASVDDFTEFQFVQPTQLMPNTNPIIEQKLNASNSMSFFPADSYVKQQHGHVPNNRNFNCFDNLASIQAPTIDHYQMTAATNTIDAVEKPSTNSSTGSKNHGPQSELELYSINKSSSPSSTHSNVPIVNNVPIEQFGCATDPMEIFSIQSVHYHSQSVYGQQQSTANTAQMSIKSDIQQLNTNQNNNNNNNNSFMVATTTTSNNNTMTTSMNSVSSIQSNSTYIGGGSSILMPQTARNVQSKQAAAAAANAADNALTIEWPEPGINTDQLEQLEARFSIQPESNTIKSNKNDTKSTVTKDNNLTTMAAADDEWTDFVSVVQPQTPITNILNKNLLKQQNNDEDDWSEFVSSTPLPANTLQQFAPPPQNLLANKATTASNTNYNNVFKPWTTTPFYQPKITGHQNTADGYAKSSNNLRYTKTVNSITNGESSTTFQSAMPKTVAPPSIISLPDLGFVAPKSLVNMPNRTLGKK